MNIYQTEISTIYDHGDFIIKHCHVDISFFQEVFILKLLQGHKNFPKMISYCIPEMMIIMKKYQPMKNPIDYKDKICDAVFYLHRMGIIHGDLKPSNMMLDGDEPIIIDFGNSHFDTQDSFQWCCTEFYAPPLQYRKREKYSFDVWSLSQIFYIDIPKNPSLRPNAEQLKHYPELIPSQMDIMVQLPTIEMDKQKWTRVYRVYRTYNHPLYALLAFSFCHLDLKTALKHILILNGDFYEKEVNTIEPTMNLIPRWCQKHKLDYNQTLWCLVKGLDLTIENVKQQSNKKVPLEYFIHIDYNHYGCYLDSEKEADELYQFFIQYKTNNETYRIFLRMYSSYCHRNKLETKKQEIDSMISNL